MSTSISTSSRTTTGAVILTKSQFDTHAQFVISGTYGTVTFVFEGSKDGVSYVPLAAIDMGTGLVATGTISPADNATKAWEVPSAGFLYVQARVTAINSGTVTFTYNSESFVGVRTIPISTSGSLVTGQVTNLVSFPVNLASITTAQDIVTNYTPGYAGKIVGIHFIVNVPVTTSAKLASINAEIGTTNLTGGVVALTSANCTPMGAVIAGTAITAANTFSSTDTISLEASSVTAFSEGSGTIVLQIQNYTA